jgi:hypothetical protein
MGMSKDIRKRAADLNSMYDMFEVVSKDGGPTKVYGKYGIALRYARIRAGRGEHLTIVGVESIYCEETGDYEFYNTVLASC